MTLDYEVFEQALTLFHHYSLQNSEAVRQMQDKGVLPKDHRRGFSIFEAKTNEDLHAVCHESRFFQELAGEQAAVAIYPITAPLYLVRSREELIVIFRMCLLNPLSAAPCDTHKLDGFIASYLDTEYPGLTYPATIPSQDDLIMIRSPGRELRGQFS